MPYPDGAFDVVVSLDVLDSDDVAPERAVAEFRRVLKTGGLLILNVAAYPWMLSYHDTAVGQSRRFTLREVRGLLEGNRLAVLQGTYWNMVLFPLMVLRRKVLPARGQGSDVRGVPRPLDALFRGTVAVERGLIRAGIRLPFGGSVLAAARKMS
jgi:SAM-dependent methyltransferase